MKSPSVFASRNFGGGHAIERAAPILNLLAPPQQRCVYDLIQSETRPETYTHKRPLCAPHPHPHPHEHPFQVVKAAGLNERLTRFSGIHDSRKYAPRGNLIPVQQWWMRA